ncbi:pyridoxal phosphate-dependent transferase [Schizophyllum amplum]|uniref:Pyridoxal phosphate-dependent transferase n=1 Tax=Schizophyllum amplum TaxID=97359 RepID=A0A550CVK2_9AGAR|nr:pyridoxal phosphate-dependent transferase [Auriculariopsis ampla]
MTLLLQPSRIQQAVVPRPTYTSSDDESGLESGPCYSEKSLDDDKPLQSSIPNDSSDTDLSIAYERFLAGNPEYRTTHAIDDLRRTDYKRLANSGETYVDWMGGALYPERLVRAHTEFLCTRVLANTHSGSNPSALSHECASAAREAVLRFFHAPAEDYTVIFTPNASGALKLIGEAYPFQEGGAFVLAADSHNSVNGIRCFASAKGADVTYIPSTSQGGLDPEEARTLLASCSPRGRRPALLALTAQSNISNSKVPLAVADTAKALGYDVLLDAAALAPTSSLSLAQHPAIDALAVSFYKMFGYPTGVGALVARKDLLLRLKRPWFAGGTVDLVQVPGDLVTHAPELHEQFEDGTVDYLALAAVSDGLRLLAVYQPLLPLRLTCLLHYLIAEVQQLRYAGTNTAVVRVLSRPPKAPGDAGATASLEFLDPAGVTIPPDSVARSATRAGIALRTGCVCNPGGAAALLSVATNMAALPPGSTHESFEEVVGRALGVVRISLGLASNFEDVWRVVKWARGVAEHGVNT